MKQDENVYTFYNDRTYCMYRIHIYIHLYIYRYIVCTGRRVCQEEEHIYMYVGKGRGCSTRRMFNKKEKPKPSFQKIDKGVAHPSSCRRNISNIGNQTDRKISVWNMTYEIVRSTTRHPSAYKPQPPRTHVRTYGRTPRACSQIQVGRSSLLYAW